MGLTSSRPRGLRPLGQATLLARPKRPLAPALLKLDFSIKPLDRKDLKLRRKLRLHFRALITQEAENDVAARHPPALTSPRLAKAFAHPTRVLLMAALNERVASPSELAEEINESLKNVAYHIKVLLELGCIELVRIEQVYGGRAEKHFYRTIQRPYVNAADWELLASNARQGVVNSIMRLVSEDITAAQTKGTFYDPDDNHISRTPLIVDEEGWQEVVSRLDKVVDDLFEIQARINGRRSQGDVETMLAQVDIIHFHATERGPKGDAA